MKRLGAIIIGGFIAVIGLLGVPLTAHADVNSFTISNYDIVYNLGSDSNGRSTLKTTETITADFPQSDQNHGIERSIPLSYQNHPTHVDVSSVTNQNKQAVPFSTYKDNGNLVVRIGSASQYVHGAQTYVVTYTQHDVTGYFKDTADDEFYWDTNGTDWAVPINHLSVTLHVASNLAQTLNGKTACYQGRKWVRWHLCAHKRRRNIYDRSKRPERASKCDLERWFYGRDVPCL